MRTLRSALVAALALVSLSCLEAPPFAPDITQVNFAPDLGVNLANSVLLPSGLYYRDIIIGNGETVRAASGDTAFVRYTGWLRNGIEFDNNLAAGSPLRFATGADAVIAGFDEGVRGMQVNGTRQLIIPPRLGYGGLARDGIPANSILVFTVTLTDVKLPTANIRR